MIQDVKSATAQFCDERAVHTCCKTRKWQFTHVAKESF